MPNSVLPSSCALNFIEQAQYSLLGPSVLQPLYNFYLALYSLSGQGARPSYFTKESLFLCPPEFIPSLHPLIYWTSFTRYKEVSPLLDIYPLEEITPLIKDGFFKIKPKIFASFRDVTFRDKRVCLPSTGAQTPLTSCQIGSCLPFSCELLLSATGHAATGNASATALLLPQQCPRSVLFLMLKTSCRIQDADPNPSVKSAWESLALGKTPGGQSDAANAANKSDE